MMVCAALIGLATASLTAIPGSVTSSDARSMSRLDVSMLLYLRLFVSIRGLEFENLLKRRAGSDLIARMQRKLSDLSVFGLDLN
jgi:hypothetical protein